MGKVILIVVILVAVVGGFFLLSSPSSEEQSVASTSSQPQEQELSYESIQQDIAASNAYLIDVRTPEEFAAGYIEEAINFPLQDIEANRYPDVDKDAALYVYCRSGNRSAVAVNLLEKEGFNNVVDLGGYQDVVALGGTLVQ